ncbi:MAG: Na+-driven multidrug efflux pump [Akkermansiaceae bacterium]|jgi:Na+-driven multidrug efflux pump
MARPGKIIEAEQRSSVQDADGSLAGRLGKLSLGRQVIALAIWPFLEQILSFMVNTVDLIRLSLPTLIRFFGLTDAAAGYAFDYLSILCWSCPVLGITLYDTFADLTLNIIWIFIALDLFVQAIVFSIIASRRKWLEAKV